MPTSAYGAAVSLLSPAAFWDFESGWADASGNGFGLTATGSPVISTANSCIPTDDATKSGAGSFGTGSYAAQSSFTSGVPTTGDCSISLWLRLSARASPNQARAVVAQYGGSNGWIFYLNDGATTNACLFRLTGAGGDTQTLATNCKLPFDDTKHHVVASYVASTKTMKYYLDGALTDTVVDAGNIVWAQAVSANKVTIGDRSGGAGFTFNGGKVDGIALFNAALSGANALTLYNAGAVAGGAGGGSQAAMAAGLTC